MHYAGALEAGSEAARGPGVRLTHAASLSGASSITVSQMLWSRALPARLPAALADKKGGAISGAAFLFRPVGPAEELT